MWLETFVEIVLKKTITSSIINKGKQFGFSFVSSSINGEDVDCAMLWNWRKFEYFKWTNQKKSFRFVSIQILYSYLCILFIYTILCCLRDSCWWGTFLSCMLHKIKARKKIHLDSMYYNICMLFHPKAIKITDNYISYSTRSANIICFERWNVIRFRVIKLD